MTEPVDTTNWTAEDWDRAMLEASMEQNKLPKKSGFFDDPNYDRSKNQPQTTCRHPDHNPPTHLMIPTGKLYRHVCTGCKKEVILQPNTAYL